MKQGLVVAAIATGAVAIGVACSDSITPTAELDVSRVAIREADVSLDRQLGALESRFQEIDDQAPGFAGFYFDRNTGDLVMRTTDLGSANTLSVLVEEDAALLTRSDGSLPQVRYELADYSFSELRGFRGAMFPHLQREEVIYVDIDEVQNKLVIGVTTTAVGPALLSIASRSGIPEGAIQVGQTVRATLNRARSSDFDAMVPSGLLSDHQDTIVGGVMAKIGPTYICSAWIGATDGGTEVLATSSHCPTDNDYADLDTDQVMAHHLTSHDAAKEWDDPALSSACGGTCTGRWADISLYTMIADSSDKFSRGWFAQTTNQIGSKTFHSTEPVLTIGGEQSTPACGQELHRVGYVSGWRKGDVVKTEVDHQDWANQGETTWLFAQDEALIEADKGDSGGPIVRLVNGVWKIVGIHAGSRDVASGVDTTIFSAMYNIEQDVGSLNTLGWPIIE